MIYLIIYIIQLLFLKHTMQIMFCFEKMANNQIWSGTPSPN